MVEQGVFMLSRLSVRKPFTIFVAVVIVLIFGGVALTKMTPDLFPNINAPVAIVLTTDPGASAEEAEKEITEPLEQQLATLPNVDQLQSVSADNFSYITLVFTDDVNMDAISVDIRDKVDQIRDQLPEGAGSPIVMKINMDMLPVAVTVPPLMVTVPPLPPLPPPIAVALPTLFVCWAKPNRFTQEAWKKCQQC